VKPALSFGRVGEFFEKVFYARRQLGEAPGLRAVLELEIRPEVLEHLDEMRLTGPEESADPYPRLLVLTHVE